MKNNDYRVGIRVEPINFIENKEIEEDLFLNAPKKEIYIRKSLPIKVDFFLEYLKFI
ncbi:MULTISPECIES: hypothetical protein [Psychrilyobacter]|uniref:hypothetical protein n=1 Tax=Psychrilyobacter TaxID=623282 RepID=UPI001314DF4C|nr:MULTISPECIES: hypothetical protein [Psychrilyobacter]NDI77470.1 hypothetical protein [Psychrilyobacter piezotolerans]